MPEDTPAKEQPTMLSFTEAAERLVADGIAQSMTAEGLRKLARDPASGWPIGSDDYRVVGKTRMLPYELLVPYMQARRRGRGPDRSGQRSPAPKSAGRAPGPKRGGQRMAYMVTLRVDVDVDAEMTPEQIEQEVHEACLALPWEFGVVSVEPEEASDG